VTHSAFKALATAVLGLTLALAGCAAPDDGQRIAIGTSVGDFGDMVKTQVKPALEAKGYTVELVEFSDYVRPNTALIEGSIDVNVFQHKPYLDEFMRENGGELTALFQVPTAPLGLYAGKSAKLADVKAGATVALPNDSTNQARALVMLRDLGWVTLKPGIDVLRASERDVAQNLKGVTLLPLEAAQLPRAREDADFAVINGNYATSAGLKLTEALYQEPSYAYVNWGVVRTKDAETPWAKDVVAAYNSPEFKAWAQKTYPGYKFPAAWGPAGKPTPAARP
jgi:D-methionine transport system substrate-binding protein